MSVKTIGAAEKNNNNARVYVTPVFLSVERVAHVNARVGRDVAQFEMFETGDDV